MAYTRPDIYYSRPIPSPSQLMPEALYTNAVINNAMSDVMMLGPFRKVMTFLQTLRFLTTGKIVPGAYGFEAKQMRTPATKTNSGGCLECLVSANLRLVHDFSIRCLNPEQPRYPGFCPEYQSQGPVKLTFPHARVRPNGQPAGSCEETGIPPSAPFCGKGVGGASRG